MGYDLRLVCRELARVVRDLMVLAVDPSRASDPEIAGESERDRLLALAKRFSREDLLRSFDLLAKAETDIRGAAQPRYHLEMALLRWIHQRKLVAIEDLIQSVGTGQALARPAPATQTSRTPPPSTSATRVVPPAPARPSISTSGRAESAGTTRPVPSAAPRKSEAAQATAATGGLGGSALRDAVLNEARRSSPILYNTVLVQAQKLEVLGDRLVLTFASSFKFGPAFEKYRATIETMATTLAGRRMTVEADGSGAEAPAPAAPSPKASADPQRQASLREQALADSGVQALLEVFPAEIRDVEEL
jgi:DNA polymerase-3 subunit gamma/tau